MPKKYGHQPLGPRFPNSQPDVFASIPTWDQIQQGVGAPRGAPAMNQFAYDKWRQNYFNKRWEAIGNPTVAGFPDWWRPGMPLNSGQGNGITSGIQSTPVSAQSIAAGAANIGAAGAGHASPFDRILNDAAQARGSAAAVDFLRNAAMQNAQYNLGSQEARAQAGLGWGQLGLQNQMGQAQYDNRLNGTLLQLLGMFQ